MRTSEAMIGPMPTKKKKTRDEIAERITPAGRLAARPGHQAML